MKIDKYIIVLRYPNVQQKTFEGNISFPSIYQTPRLFKNEFLNNDINFGEK